MLIFSQYLVFINLHSYLFQDSGATIPKERIFLDPDHGTFGHPLDSADQDRKLRISNSKVLYFLQYVIILFHYAAGISGNVTVMFTDHQT